MEPLRFSNEVKLRRQMNKRGWSEDEIREALATTPVPAVGKRGPALRFEHPTAEKSVIIDAVTGEIFHLGKKGFRYG